jgi:hypothetical protein
MIKNKSTPKNPNPKSFRPGAIILYFTVLSDRCWNTTTQDAIPRRYWIDLIVGLFVINISY